MAFKTNTSFLNLDLKYPTEKSNTLYDIPIGSISSSHNGVACSRKNIIFQCTQGNNRLAVAALDARGSLPLNQLNHLLIGNNEVTDFAPLFYPGDKELVAVASKASPVKLFDLSQFNDEVGKSTGTPTIDYTSTAGNIASISCHPGIDYLLACGGTAGYDVCDISVGQSVYTGLAGLPVKWIEWDVSGSELLAIHAKTNDKIVAIVDVRGDNVVSEYTAHQGPGRECRILSAGKYVVTTGFSKSRVQEMVVYDKVAGKILVRKMFESSTSVVIPMYDHDSGRIFYGAKGSNSISSALIANYNEGTQPNVVRTLESTAGLCLMPKMKVDVMACEVQRIHQLNKNGIVPISAVALRRQESIFRADLFPDTQGLKSGGSVEDWRNKTDVPVPLINLQPENAKTRYEFVGEQEINRIGDVVIKLSEDSPTIAPQSQQNGSSQTKPPAKTNGVDKPAESYSKPTKQDDPVVTFTEPIAAPPRMRANPIVSNNTYRASTVNRARSQYYNINYKPLSSVTSLRNVHTRIPAEGTFFAASGSYAAVPLEKIDGHLSVYNLSVPGRVPDGTMDGFFNAAQILDVHFDPFNDEKLVCGLGNGFIKVWDIGKADRCKTTNNPFCTNVHPPIPERGPGMLNVDVPDEDNHKTLSKLEPEYSFHCGVPKVVLVRYNPAVQDLVAIGGSNGVISLLNLQSGKFLYNIKHHSTSVTSIAWNTEGTELVSVDKNNKVVISDGRTGAVIESSDSVATDMRNARVIFVGPVGGEMLLFTYLEKGTRHRLVLTDLKLKQLKDADLGQSKGGQSMRAYFDYDSCLVFITTKGDSSIQIFHVVVEEPYLLDIMPATFNGAHQAITFLPKLVVDPKIKEIVRVPRLTLSGVIGTIEQVSFRVPRKEENAYLRELYPVSLDTWRPSVEFEQWHSGAQYSRRFVDLKPDDLIEIAAPDYDAASNGKTESNTSAVKSENVPPSDPQMTNGSSEHDMDSEAIRAELVKKEWSNAIAADSGPAPQDLMEGVDPDEWQEEEDN